MTVRGIDVSRWQGDFDWRQHPGLQFGMCKATEWQFTDLEFRHNWDGMWAYQADHRMPRFAYCFFHASMDPARQAEQLVTAVKAHGLLAGDNFVLDLEATDPDTGLNDDLPPAEVARRGIAFLHRVNAMAPGHRVLVYSYPAFIRAGNCAGMGAWYLWIANYLVSQPEVDPPWDKWTFWQDGDSPVDTDQFNGDLAALLAFTRMPDKR